MNLVKLIVQLIADRVAIGDKPEFMHIYGHTKTHRQLGINPK